jgi:outer membrane protein TolC
MKLSIIICSTAALAGVAHAGGAARRLTFKEAIDLALSENPELGVAKEAVLGADAHTAGAKARRLPSVHVDGYANLYSKPYQLPFGTEVFTLHESVTTAATLTVSQPLTGLAYLSELIGAAEHEASAKRNEYDKARLDIAYRTADAYIRVLETRATAEVAKQSVADIQSGLDRATQLRKADVYTDIDVLRFRSAKAAADQAALRAQSTSDAAIAGLVLELGLRDGADIEIGDDLPMTPPPLAVAIEAAQQRAIAARPELRAARERVAAANSQRRSARLTYLPDVRAVGVYEHTTGVEPFQPADTAFLGLRMSWNIWDWGGTHQAVLEAEHAQNKARFDVDVLGDQVRLDVRKRWLDAKTAFDSLAVAKTQQETAEEAYRLQKVRFDAAAATTTDVLDAETDAARARLVFAVARYDYYLALVKLARSVGDLPNPQR